MPLREIHMVVWGRELGKAMILARRRGLARAGWCLQPSI